MIPLYCLSSAIAFIVLFFLWSSEGLLDVSIKVVLLTLAVGGALCAGKLYGVIIITSQIAGAIFPEPPRFFGGFG